MCRVEGSGFGSVGSERRISGVFFHVLTCQRSLGCRDNSVGITFWIDFLLPHGALGSYNLQHFSIPGEGEQKKVLKRPAGGSPKCFSFGV